MPAKEHYFSAILSREVPLSVLLDYAKQLNGLPEEEARNLREVFAKEIEEKYPYKPGKDPDLPGIPLAEVVFTYPANVNIGCAARRLNIKRDRIKTFYLLANLDIGDIQKRIDSKYRRCLAGRMRIGFCHDDEFGEDELLQNTLLYQNWIPLKKYLDEGKHLRIWYSDAPEELCGFYHLCTLLKEHDQPFYAVRLPETIMINGKRKRVYSWNQIPEDAILGEVENARLLSAEEIALNAKTWTRLRKENAPLRAVINGRLVSVPEDFYDPWLIRCIPKDKPIAVEDALNLFYGQLYSPCSGWLIHRIDELIRQKKIELVEEHEYVWKQRIRLATS